MDFMNYQINKDEQYIKIIEDTEEIIKNFGELSDLVITKLDKTESSMFTLGKKVIHDRKEFLDQSFNLGNKQVDII